MKRPRNSSKPSSQLDSEQAKAVESQVQAVSPVSEKDLARCLRGFAASVRLKQVTVQSWRAARDQFLSNPNLGADDCIISIFRLLRESANSADVSNSESTRCEVRAVQSYTNTRRNALVKRLKSLFNLDDDDNDDDEVEIVSLPKKRRALVSSSNDQDDDEVLIVSPDVPERAPETQHLNGAFDLIRLKNEPESTPFTLSLSDVVHAGCELAVAVNFMWDLDWVFESAPALLTTQKFVLVHGMDVEYEPLFRETLARQGMKDRTRIHRPKTPPFGTVHAKLWVLFYGQRGCRIFLSTANNVTQDWGPKTQGGWMRDFPRKIGEGEMNGFGTELTNFLSKCVPDDIMRDVQRELNCIDFSAADAHLVASVPGVHRGEDLTRFGHMRLRTLLSNESIPESGAARTVCQFSSLGSIRQQWLEGEFAATLFASKERTTSHSQPMMQGDDIQIVFPTVEQVVNSLEGIIAGASLPVRADKLNRPHIKNRLHRWQAQQSGRQRAIPHIKTYLRYDVHNPNEFHWIFLGSFNLSVAAWGRLQGARGKRPPDRINILSYELGVLMTRSIAKLRRNRHSIAVVNPKGELGCIVSQKACNLRLCKAFSSKDLGAYDDNAPTVEVPLPYSLPPRKYSSSDVGWTIDMLQ